MNVTIANRAAYALATSTLLACGITVSTALSALASEGESAPVIEVTHVTWDTPAATDAEASTDADIDIVTPDTVVLAAPQTTAAPVAPADTTSSPSETVSRDKVLVIDAAPQAIATVEDDPQEAVKAVAASGVSTPREANPKRGARVSATPDRTPAAATAPAPRRSSGAAPISEAEKAIPVVASAPSTSAPRGTAMSATLVTPTERATPKHLASPSAIPASAAQEGAQRVVPRAVASSAPVTSRLVAAADDESVTAHAAGPHGLALVAAGAVLAATARRAARR